MTALFKTLPVRDRAYLDHLRTERCICTGQLMTTDMAVDPAHIGKRGLGYKASDDEVLPLWHELHAMQDQLGEASMYRRYLPDDVLLAALKALARERYRKWKEAQ